MTEGRTVPFPSPTRQRSIRVFVSSTFRDMQRERDELVKRVFPQLRKRCSQRGVAWSEVDLRWGISDEQKADGQVLPVCLAEIQRCRPFFIGLLGERYGWVPDEIGADLVEGRPWLGEHSGGSVTEMEITEGALRNPDMASHAFFYLRDPAYIDTRPAAEQPELREVPSPEEIRQWGPEIAEGRAQQRRHKLENLKGRIRSSGFPVRDNYPDPQALGDLVLADLTALIDQLYPEGTEPDPLEREAAEQEAFAANRTTIWVGRHGHLEHLDTHTADDGPPLLVLGESGAGKSALLANWARRYRDTHPDEFVLTHFIGSSPHSSDWVAMVRRLGDEIDRRCGIEEETPDEPEPLRRAFARRLHLAATRGRLVMVIDGLNHLQDRDGAPDLAWLPPEIPANVRLVLSTSAGRPLDEAARRGWPTLQILPLDSDDRKALIRRYLRHYAKELSPDRTERIAARPQTANPLYLRALLEELRLWGVHETLDETIEHYLGAETIDALYERILARYEADYQQIRPALVRDAMALLWAAKRGLSEAELLDLLGTDESPLPQAHWSPLSLAAEQSLANNSGLISLSHHYFRRAIEDRYLPEWSERQAAHLRLAEYFDPRRDEQRGIDELPWQLAEAGAWPRLGALLGDPEFFRRAWDTSEYEVKTYWARVEANSPLRLIDTYGPLIADTAPPATWALGLSKLLLDTGHAPEAGLLLERSAELCRARADASNLLATLVNLAAIDQSQGELDKAAHRFKEAEQIARQLGDPAGLHRSLGNRASILLIRGEMTEAAALLKEQERICRRIGDRAGLAVSLGNQALILQKQGQLEAAMALHREEERICREQGDPTGLHRSLGNQAAVLRIRGEWDEALARYREWGENCRRLGDRSGLQISLGNQATILVARGDLDSGMTLLREQEQICRELGDQAGLHHALGNQGAVLLRRGRCDEAMVRYREKERICRGLGDQAGLHLALGNQGQILKTQGQLDAAMELLQQQEQICRQLDDMEGLQDSLGNQGATLLEQGELNRATALLEEQERICRELGHRAGLATSLGNQALVYRQRGQSGTAMAILEEVEGIFRELGDVLELAKTLVNRGMLTGEAGRADLALDLIRAGLQVAAEHGLSDLEHQIEQLLTHLIHQIQQASRGGSP